MSKEFVNRVKKIDCKRNHLVKNAYGAGDYWEYYQQKRKRKINQAKFTAILRDIINDLVDTYLMNYLSVTLPSRMGELIIKKRKYTLRKNPDGTYSSNAPVDWAKTLDLWERDEVAHKQKLRVRRDGIYYNKLFLINKAGCFKNHYFYKFRASRVLTQKIYQELTLNNKFKLWQNSTPQ